MINRLDKVKDILTNEQCTHILVTDSIDAEYVSGFHSSNVTLLISQKQNIIFTDFRYKEAAEKFCCTDLWKFNLVTEGNYKYLSGFVEKGSVIGIQSDSVTIDQYDNLRKACRGSRLVKLSNLVTDTAQIKTAQEISSIQKAAKIADLGFEQLLKQLKVGMTEIVAAQTLELLCSEFGSEKPAFETIALFGARSALPHGRPSNVKLKKGDFVLFDFGCTYRGFYSDITRTVVMGKASERHKEVYSIVKDAQEKARIGARAGLKCSELDNMAREIIVSKGYGEQFGHALGHGVGRRIHERPRVSSQVDDILPEGAVVTIEPGIYIPGFGGVRIEDMVVLGTKNAKVLTHSPRELIEIS